MQTTDQWVNEKVSAYLKNPSNILEEMLVTTNMVVQQYLNAPTLTTKGVLESCALHNELFIQTINEINN